MSILIILNRDAGTLKGTDPEAAADRIATIFRDAGHDVSVALEAGRDAVAAIAVACDGGTCETLIVGGGDGTVSAAASAAARSGTTLGILPLGTMNLFARALAIPLDLDEAARALASGERISVDIGEVNGRTFIHHVTLGLHAKLLKTREKMTYASRGGKVLASLQAWWMAVREPPRIAAEIELNGRTLRRRTAAILITNNPLGDGHLPHADDPRDGTLALYVVTTRSLAGLIDLAVRIVIGAISGNPHLESWLAREIAVVPAAPVVDASVDGEVVRLDAPIRCRVRRHGLAVLAPRPHPPDRGGTREGSAS